MVNASFISRSRIISRGMKDIAGQLYPIFWYLIKWFMWQLLVSRIVITFKESVYMYVYINKHQKH